MFQEITDDSLQELIDNNDRVLVQYSAGWCGNCRIMKPKFKKMASEHEAIPFVLIDAEKNPKKDEATNGLYARNSGQAIVELNSVYFLNKKFGCTWKTYQLVVHEPQNLKGFQFIL